MSLPLYLFLRVVIGCLQALPLRVVAATGRALGGLAWRLRLRFRRVALRNLTLAFPEKSRDEILALGHENMRRIGENYASAIKTASMSLRELEGVCRVVGVEKLPSFESADRPRNCIVAIGHFGNFELFAMLAGLVPGIFPAATYRGLNDPRINRLMQKLRSRSGCHFFERRSQAGELKQALNKGGVLLGLLSDQHTSGGVWGPFLGRDCFTTSAPALFALRYDAPLYTAFCFRTALARWRIELGDPIPTHENGAPREVAAITAEVNRAFEVAVRRDPANWFWVHNRWKPNPRATAPPGQTAATADIRKEPASP